MKLELAEVLRDAVRTNSLAALGSALSNHVASSRSVVLTRVWFFNRGILSLASSAGTPGGGGSYTRIDGEFREMAVADSKIREIAESGEPFVVRGVRGDEEWLTNSAWAARQGVRAFLAFPMLAQGGPVGVWVVFDREMPDDELVARMRLVADIAAYRAAELANRAALTSVTPTELVTSTAARSYGPLARRPSLLAVEGSAREGWRSPGGTEVLTRADLRRIEKQNIEAALARTRGKVFGSDGAAALLGMRPTTLASRLKALGIR